MKLFKPSYNILPGKNRTLYVVKECLFFRQRISELDHHSVEEAFEEIHRDKEISSSKKAWSISSAIGSLLDSIYRLKKYTYKRNKKTEI